MTKKLSLFIALCSTMAFAHPADPNLLLAKYTLYGKDGIVSSPNVMTEPSGKGWIGTDQTLSGSGSTTMYGPLKIGGTFQAQGGTYYGSMDVLGNITNSGGTPIFGKVSDGADTIRYNGSISSYTGSPVLRAGQALVDIPIFPTYAVNPDLSRNCTLAGATWSGTGCPISGQSAATRLPPGRYGDVVISSGAKGYFTAGNYEFNSLTIYDTLVVDKATKDMCRLMVKGTFSLKQTGVGALLTKLPGDYGRVLIYTEGTTVETQQGQTLMATLLTKNATVSLNPNFKIYGQVLAKSINLANGFNGASGAFVPFQPLGLRYAGVELLDENEGTPTLFGDNSRLITLPVEMPSPLNSNISVQFRIIPSPTGTPVTFSTNGDFDTSAARGSFAKGTLNFAPNSTSPIKNPTIYLNDDLLYEGIENLRLELWGASPADSVGVDGADTLTGLGYWDLQIRSDDPSNQAPNGMTLSNNVLFENAAKGTLIGKFSAQDSDTGQSYGYRILSGNGFRISNDSLFADSVYDYESGIRQINLRIRVQDYKFGNVLFAGTDTSYFDKDFVIQIRNLNDNSPIGGDDSLGVDEGQSSQILSNGINSLLANDRDVDSLGAMRVRILTGPQNGTLVLDSLKGTFTYTHNDSENFTDSALILVADSIYLGVQHFDTTVLRISIKPINDNGPKVVLPLGDSTRLEDFRDTVLVSMAGRYSDLDGDSLTQSASKISGNVQWSFQNGLLKLWSLPDSNGKVRIQMRISDGLASHDLLDTLDLDIIPVNDAPLLQSTGISVPEDTGLVTFVQTRYLQVSQVANELNQTHALKILSSTNSALYALGGQPRVDSLGRLSFQGASNAIGTDTLRFLVRDNGGVAYNGTDSSIVNVILQIRPVNDAPDFARGADTLVFPEDTGAILVAWANSISKGPSNEGNQKLNFKLWTSAQSLFAVQPSMDSLGNLSLTTAPDSNGIAKIFVRLYDDGGVADHGVDSSKIDSFFVKIIPVNDAPMVKSSLISVPEDTGLVTFSQATYLQVSQVANEANQKHFLQILGNTNSALYAVGGQPRVDSVGRLSFQGASNAFGTDTLRILVRDDGGVVNGGIDSSIVNVILLIRPVNDAPDFARGADTLVFPEDTGSILVAWANSISKGPSNEGNQKLNFKLWTSAQSLFAVQPGLDSLGNLSLTTAPDANGIAKIFVRLYDDGGIADHGADSSKIDSFFVNILPVNDLPRLNTLIFVKKENNPDHAQIDNAIVNGLQISVLDNSYWLAKEVDGEKMGYLLSDSIVEIDSLGQIFLRKGVQLDYERKQSSTFNLGVFAGLDTVWKSFELRVLNEIEWTKVIAQKTWIGSQNWDAVHNDTLWTNQDSARIAWEVESLADTITYQLVANAENILDSTYHNPTKDSAGQDQVVIRMNKVGPVLTLNDSALRHFDGIYYSNKIDQVLHYNIHRVNRNLSIENVDTSYTEKWTEGKHDVRMIAYDVYGNVDTLDLVLVIDTTKPKVKITSPKTGDLFHQVVASVEWTVDGSAQDSLLTESLHLGADTVVRQYTDLAGNSASDTVIVHFELDNSKYEVSILNDVVHDGSALAEQIQKRADERGRDLLDQEMYSISLLDSSGKKGAEIVYGSQSRTVLVPLDQSPVIGMEKSTNFGMDVHLTLPFNGGKDQAGNDREGLCDNGLPMWKQGIASLEIEIFDQSGQFVHKFKPIKDSIGLSPGTWQDDRGQIGMRVEIMPADGQMRAETGRRWATGVYLLRISTQLYSIPINCNPEIKTQLLKRNLLRKIGFVRGS